MRVLPRRIPVLLLPALFLLAPATAHALSIIPSPSAISVSVPLPGLLGEYVPGGEMRTVEWDVGQEFTAIDGIELRLVAEDTITSSVCTAGIPGSCGPLSILCPRVYTNEENRPPFYRQTTPRPGFVRTTIPTPPVVGEEVTPIMVDGEPVNLIRPIFGYMAFLEGHGFLDVDFRLIGDFGADGSPGTITQAELVVIGTPVPEPTTLLLLVVGLMADAARRRTVGRRPS